MPPSLTSDQRKLLLRWRLILGPHAEQASSWLRLGAEPLELGEEAKKWLRSFTLRDLDEALTFVYAPEERGAGLGEAMPYIPRWLEAIRNMFSQDIVVMLQKDAIERKGLIDLLLEPETLPRLERNVELVVTLLALKDRIPEQVKETARQIVRDIAGQLRSRLENEVRQTILGALRRNRHAPLRVYRNIDWKRTIRRSLKNYDPERRVVIPERFYFWASERRFYGWQIVLVVDQSGSMATSVVYSSIMASIFASLHVLQTRLILFSTEVVDLTPHLQGDPVDLLFGAQLGGGTDIAKAVAYAAAQIQNPEKTLFILISDLYEGGDETLLLQQLQHLIESRVRVLCLLALQDRGWPAYNQDLARRVAALGIPAFAATPRKLLETIERILGE
ncbi:VWA domain-containing protein [Thermoflexus sp.]|uniref:VWA domain-containing protein n=1 Tax=Thermoflexus sp. TaxID=1969742 RepID=UPI002ADD46CB|nr:VWA domain-containing protein [Thermoflexus sp.]